MEAPRGLLIWLIFINAPEGCPHGTHTSGTAYYFSPVCADAECACLIRRDVIMLHTTHNPVHTHCSRTIERRPELYFRQTLLKFAPRPPPSC